MANVYEAPAWFRNVNISVLNFTSENMKTTLNQMDHTLFQTISHWKNYRKFICNIFRNSGDTKTDVTVWGNVLSHLPCEG